MKLRFYEHFACGYGTLWLLVFGHSYITRTEFHFGENSIYGMLVLALIYALMRRAQDRRDQDLLKNLQSEVEHLRGERTAMLRAVQEIEKARRPPLDIQRRC